MVVMLADSLSWLESNKASLLSTSVIAEVYLLTRAGNELDTVLGRLLLLLLLLLSMTIRGKLFSTV